MAFVVTSKIRVSDHYSIVAADDAVEYLPLGLDLAAAAAAATTLEPDQLVDLEKLLHLA